MEDFGQDGKKELLRKTGRSLRKQGMDKTVETRRPLGKERKFFQELGKG